MSNINVYDIGSNTWYEVNVTGEIPPSREYHCSGIASEPRWLWLPNHHVPRLGFTGSASTPMMSVVNKHHFSLAWMNGEMKEHRERNNRLWR
jgi:hypothetical protein